MGTTAQSGSHVRGITVDVVSLLLTSSYANPDFAVNSSSLGLGFDVGNSYAGNINVQRENHPNNTLYFWGFESQSGSLTAGPGELSDRPWAVWLQGG